MQKLFLFVLLFSGTIVSAQPKKYTVANAHSHNDYAQALPFTDAYDHSFGSMEADIFLLKEGDSLWVAHNLKDIETHKRSLNQLYLIPLVHAIKKNNGHIYQDPKKVLQLLVDIKSDATATLDQLVAVIKQYPQLTSNPGLVFAISGNRPDPTKFSSYPSFIQFDGVIGMKYDEAALSRIVMMSAPFQQFSKWNGEGSLPSVDSVRIATAISSNHKLGKPVRLWGAPDSPNAWKVLMGLGVDFINTDKIAELSDYLKN